MRTKTLLVGALGLVAAATVSAQVYSVNVVGYVNSPMKKGFNLVSNPLDNKGTGNNTIPNLFAGVPEGTTIYKFVGGKYDNANSFVFGVWDNDAQTLAPGEGAFVYLESDATITFVGDVKQGLLETPLKKGFNMVSSQVPQAGKLTTDLGYTTPAEGDTVYQHTRGGGYKPSIAFQFGAWDPAEPVIEVGEAFWLYTEADGKWSRNFTVN